MLPQVRFRCRISGAPLVLQTFVPRGPKKLVAVGSVSCLGKNETGWRVTTSGGTGGDENSGLSWRQARCSRRWSVGLCGQCRRQPVSHLLRFTSCCQSCMLDMSANQFENHRPCVHLVHWLWIGLSLFVESDGCGSAPSSGHPQS